MSENENQVVTKHAEKHHFPWRTIGIIITAFAIIVLIVAYSIGYFQLVKTNVQLANRIKAIEFSANDLKNQMMNLKATMDDTKSNLQVINQQNNQYEKIISDLQGGNLTKWYLAEAEYLVNLANDQVQFTHQYQIGLALLQRALQLLESIADPSLLEVRKAIALNISQLQHLNVADITTIFTRLNAVDQQIDQLPVQMSFLKNDQTTKVKTSDVNKSWWQRGMDRTWEGLQKIVIVKKNIPNDGPFMMPDQKIFLLQNIHSKLQFAMWAALHRNTPIYQLSLIDVNKWITHYFDQSNNQTKMVLANINELQHVLLEAPTINFAETIKLFRAERNREPKTTTNPQPAEQSGIVQ